MYVARTIYFKIKQHALSPQPYQNGIHTYLFWFFLTDDLGDRSYYPRHPDQGAYEKVQLPCMSMQSTMGCILLGLVGRNPLRDLPWPPGFFLGLSGLG
jgi:hypothetical protein